MELQEHSNSVYIMGASRTAIGSVHGQFGKIPATILGANVIRQCLRDSQISTLHVSEVIMGQVLTAGQGLNPARYSAFKANISVKVPASTVNMGWGSGFRAIYQGYNSIRSGNSKVVVCGGQENITMAHHFVYLRENQDSYVIKDSLLVDGLTDGSTRLHIGKTAEKVARAYHITREEQDKYANESQVKAFNAAEKKYFFPEIVPVLSNIIRDESIQPDTKLEQLFQSPVLYEYNLEKDPTITAGNSFTFGDGAAAVVLCNDEYRLKHCLIPLAKIVAFVQAGFDISNSSDPLGPARAIDKVIIAANWLKDQIDLYEINELFAAQVLAIIKIIEVNPAKVNVAGGAIALGDPPGASGARMLVTLIHNLRRLNLTRGIGFMWIGEAVGMAVAIEMPT